MSYLDELKEQYQEAADEANEKIEQFLANLVHYHARQGSKVITVTAENCQKEGLYFQGVENFLKDRGIETKKQDKPVGLLFTL